MIFRLLLQVPPLLWALSQRSSKALRIYFVAQLVNIALTEGAYGRVAGLTYALFYMIGLACIVGAICELLIVSRVTLWQLALSVIMAAPLWVLAAFMVHGVGSYITMWEGIILTIAAFALGFRAMFSPNKIVSVSLSILWLALAFFDLIYTLGVPVTNSLQYWLPAALIGAAMIVIGFGLKAQTEVPQT